MVVPSGGWLPVSKRPRGTLSRPASPPDDPLSGRLRQARVAALLTGNPGRVDLSPDGASDLDALIAKTAALYAQSITDSTRKTYVRRWHLFTTWCAVRDLPSLPTSPETAMLYLADAVDGEHGAALGTLRGWIAAINRVHVEAGLTPPGDDPAMTMFLHTLSRVVAPRTAQVPISALRVGDLRTVCRALDAAELDPVEVRDRAVLTLHRSGVGDGEMGRLRWENVSFTPRSAVLHLVSPRPDRSDRTIRIRAHREPALCGVEALRTWRHLAGTDIGWVFTQTDSKCSRINREWDSRAIRRIRLARLDSLGRDGHPATLDEAITLLGGKPSMVLRDKAMLLLGFAGAFRRPDLCGFNWSDLTVTDAGLVAHLRRSKTDLEGHGADVGIPRGMSPLTCPVIAMEAWRARCEQQLGRAGLGQMPCFPRIGRAGRIGIESITPEALTRMVRRRVEEVSVDGRWGGRSLRAGFISTAADLDIPLEAIAKQSRHATLDSLIRYIRNEDPFRRNPAAQVGL